MLFIYFCLFISVIVGTRSDLYLRISCPFRGCEFTCVGDITPVPTVLERVTSGGTESKRDL